MHRQLCEKLFACLFVVVVVVVVVVCYEEEVLHRGSPILSAEETLAQWQREPLPCCQRSPGLFTGHALL